MVDDALPVGYEQPLHTALTSPILLGGVPRTSWRSSTPRSPPCWRLGARVPWIGMPLGFLVHAVAAFVTARDPWFFTVPGRHLRLPAALDS